MALFCTAINDSLIDFGDEGKSHEKLWIRVKGAINFLSYYPEQKREDTRGFPKYGFRDGVRRLTYEQLVATQNFLKRHRRRLLQTKKKLPMILDLNLGVKQRKSAARYCIELFSGLHGEYNWYVERPPNFGMPRGIEKLLGPSKSRGKTKPAKTQ